MKLFLKLLLIGLLGLFSLPDNSIKVLKKNAVQSTMYEETASYLDNVIYIYNNNFLVVRYYLNAYVDISLEDDTIYSVELYYDCDFYFEYYDAQEGYQEPLITSGYSFSSPTYLVSDDLSIHFPFDIFSMSIRLLNTPSLERDGGFILQVLPVINIDNIQVNSQLLTYQEVSNEAISEIYTNAPAIWSNILYGERIRLNSTQNNYLNLDFITQLKTLWEQEAFTNGKTEGIEDGYELGFTSGYEEGLTEGTSQNTFMNTIKQLFNVVNNSLSIEILPNIKLWYIIGVPLVLSVLKFVIGWFR